MPSTTKKVSHLTFTESEVKLKTKVWLVESNYDDSILGTISWLGKWRQYVFHPFADCVWSSDCLQEVAEFLINQNKEHKEHKKEPKGVG
jgi:hypothetical protein